jgi:hypothetical protein
MGARSGLALAHGSETDSRGAERKMRKQREGVPQDADSTMLARAVGRRACLSSLVTTRHDRLSQ